jgi:hypothetical protein
VSLAKGQIKQVLEIQVLLARNENNEDALFEG